MSNSFLSTSGQSFRRPVDTFVAPVSVTPKSSMMDLAETLANINPVLQNYIVKKGVERNEKKIVEGQQFILEADNETIKKALKAINDKDGERAKRDFLGNNKFFRIGVERQLAINLGNAAEANTEKFFNSYVIPQELPDGTTINTNLSSYDVNSAAFDNALSEFNRTSLMNTKGIRPEILNKYFLPKQNAALRKVFDNQISSSADAKINQMNVGFADSLLSSWKSIDYYDKNIKLNLIDNNGFIDGENYALNEMQENTDYMANLGLTSSVSPSNMFKILKTSAYKIFNDYKEQGLNMNEAMKEIEDFIDFAGFIKVGPSSVNKQGVKVQKDLKSYITNEILNLKKDLYKNVNDANKQEKDFAEQAELTDIDNRLDELDFESVDLNVIRKNAEIINGIQNNYKGRLEFINKEVSLRNFNVDGWWQNFRNDWVNGEYEGNKIGARQDLINFMSALGTSATKEDQTKYKELDNLVKTQSGKSVIDQYPEIKALIKYGDRVVSSIQNPLTGAMEMDNLEAQKKYDLDQFFKQQINDVITDMDIDERQKRNIINDLKSFYKGQLVEISKQTYTFNNPENDIEGMKNQIYERNRQTGEFQLRNNNRQDESTNTFSDVEDPFLNINKKVSENISDNIIESGQRIVSDVVNSLGATDGSLLAMAPVDEQEEETIKIVGTEEPSGVKRFEANFPVFYKLAKDAGHKFPEVTAAQVMLETSGGATPSATNNYLGLKATQDETDRGESTLQNTTENENGEVVSIQDNFKNFNSLQDMMIQYKREWNDDFMGRKGTVNVDTAEKAAKLLQANVFATDPDYAKKIMQIIRDAKRNPPLF